MAPWAGLGRSHASYPNTLMDDAPAQSYWWTAIGATQGYNPPDTIPGPRGHGPRNNVVKKVYLYVRQNLKIPYI